MGCLRYHKDVSKKVIQVLIYSILYLERI